MLYIVIQTKTPTTDTQHALKYQGQLLIDYQQTLLHMKENSNKQTTFKHTL
jgi:hypothetical protein